MLTKIRAAFAALPLGGIMYYVRRAGELLKHYGVLAGGKTWESLKDTFSRKTTWLALAVVFVVGWVSAWIVLGESKDRLRTQRDEVAAAYEREKAAAAVARRDLATAQGRVTALAGELEELRKTPPVAAPAPAKPVPRPTPVAKAAPKAEPAPAPAVPVFSWPKF